MLALGKTQGEWPNSDTRLDGNYSNFTLVHGMSGEICFFSDLLRDETDVKLPGLEI
jgi:hypothetical protein